MQLFDLLAKLTLDRKEYDSEVASIEKEKITIEDPHISLNTDDFDTKVDEINNTQVDGPDNPELGLDNEQFKTGVEESQTLSESFGTTVKSIFDQIGGVLITGGIVGAVTSVVGALKEGVELAKQHGDTIHKQSAFLGLTTEAYQELDYALQLSGSSITEFSRSMKSFQQMAAGDITDKQAEAFEKLGIEASKAADSQDLMYKSLYALADYTGNDRDIIAKALFGNNYNKLDRLLEAGSKGIRDMQEEAKGLGFVMTDEEIQNAADYMDATTRLDMSLNAIKESFAASIIPLLTAAANELAKIIAMFNWRTGDTSIDKIFEDIDKNGANALVTMEQNEAEAKSLVDKLASMGDYWTLDESGKKTWNELAKELTKLYPELDKVINDNKNAFLDNTEAIKANIEELTKLEQQRILNQNLAEKRNAIAEQYVKALDKEIDAEKKSAEADGKRASAMKALNELLTGETTNANVLQMQKEFGAKYGTLTNDNFASVASWFSQNYAVLDYGLRNSITDWENTTSEAEKLRKEAETLTQKADEAQATYTEYAQALADKLGITLEKTEEVTAATNEYKRAIDAIPSKKTTILELYEEKTDGYHASGAWSIPYDNYHAVLHRGEQVLSASQARQSGGGGDMSHLEDRIIAAIKEGMSDATVNAYMDGKKVSQEVSENLARENGARRYG